MLYLLQQLLVPLALAAVFGGGLAGWSWHCLRNRALWAERDGERNRLRNELLALSGYQPALDDAYTLGSVQIEALTKETEELRRVIAEKDAACALHDKRIAELEASLKATASDTGAAARLGELEAALNDARTKAGELERRAQLLETDLDKATAPQGESVEVSAMRWRARYLDNRVSFLEAEKGLAGAVAPVEDLSDELSAARVRIGDLEDALSARPVGSEDDLNRERWKSRYLVARVNYLEEQANLEKPPAPQVVVAPPPVIDVEAENRKRWRQRYLEARVAWLEGRVRDAGPRVVEAPQAIVDTSELDAARADLDKARADGAALRERLTAAESRATQAVGERARLAGMLAEKEGALAGATADGAGYNRRVADLEAERVRLLARIAELENAPPPPAPPALEPVEDPAAAREKWRTRYLDSRVRFLEQSIAMAPKANIDRPPPPRDDTFAPLESGAEVRPQGLPAARGGAPDDLRMIEGITPRIESTLNSLGVYHFDQIAAWSSSNIDWIERYLAFKGRIGREKWVEQARTLVLGEGDGRRRYREGEHV